MNERFSVNTKLLSVFFACFFVILTATTFPKAGEFELNSPYWYILFDRAGYVDITEWYPSPLHDFGPHEMLTGDWAAAVYYDGIDTSSNQAAWLTDEFIIPNIDPTNSPFDFTAPSSEAYDSYNDPNNPVWTDGNQSAFLT